MTILVTSLDAAAVALQSGDPAIFPTDTVFGLGVSVRHAASPAQLFRLKGRPAGKPVAWLVASPDDLLAYGEDVPDLALAWARAFWPGPLTLIVKASSQVPPAFQSETGTLGLRMPDNPTALALIRQVGCPLATTSANPSGLSPAFTLNQLDSTLAEHVGVVVADHTQASGLASTVIDCTGSEPVLLREGAITAADLAAAH